jgi:conjugative relaxase-like TrwC/TraI family protein
MLSFQAVGSSKQAAHYFESADDYYEKESQRGEWMGKGAEELGLTQHAKVDRESFKDILDGKLPNGQLVRFANTRLDDRKGIDYTFSAPKSVSMQALIAGDTGVTAAHDRAVKRAVQQLEKLAYARIKEQGQSYRVRTGVIVAAAFRHELSRAQDPQLHTHVIVANLTKRPDGQWRAMSNEEIQRNIKTLGSYYRAALAEELRSSGYDLRETQKGYWEMAHIGDDLIQHFSTRAKQIEAAFEARGVDRDTANTALAQSVTLMTRDKKTEVDRTMLREEWIGSARAAGLSLESLNVAKDRSTVPNVEQMRNDPAMRSAAAVAINFSIEHLSERQGLFTRKEMVELSMSKAATTSTIASVMAEVEAAEADGRLVRELPLYQTARSMNQAAQRTDDDSQALHFVDLPETAKLTRATWIGATMHARNLSEEQATAEVDRAIQKGALVLSEARYTTPQAQAVERSILAIERDGRGVMAPILNDAGVAARLKASDLNEGQREAVDMILNTTNRFVSVQGYAGTGKSHMLSKAIDEITQATAKESKAAGHEVIGLAPYGTQVAALRELGVDSNTLASFLSSKKAQAALSEKSVVILDEAGVVPAHQLAKAMRIVEDAGARMVMLGDRKQTGAIEAGKPFAQLQDAGMVQAQLREIQRQRNPEIKAAVLNAAHDLTNKAVTQLNSRIVEVPVNEERYQRIAKDFTELQPKERDATLIVAGTNEARHSINGLVREGLNLQGGRAYTVLENVDATRAELKQAATYGAAGLVVHYHREGQNIKRGEEYAVVRVANDQVFLTGSNGQTVSVKPSQQFAATLHKKYDIQIAPGDLLKITKTDKQLGLLNGDRVRVQAVSADAITVKTERGVIADIPANRPMNLQHGYATTVHSSQGLTSNRVLIEVNTRSLTTNRAAFYVAISRPRHELTLYADNAGDLRKAVARVPKKYAALELRTPQSEAHVARQKRDQIAVKRIRNLTVQLRRSIGQPRPVQENLSVVMGRALRGRER